MTEDAQRIRLIGAPVEAGAGRRGCLMGPAALRVAGLAEALAARGLTVEDAGDLAPAPAALTLAGHAKAAGEIAGWTRAIAAATHEAAASGAIPILLGGDHSLAMGSVAGMARVAAERGRALHVLWLDAHADFNTPATSPSGNMHGMSCAFFCGEPGFEGMLDSRTPVAPRRLHIYGARSIDDAERALLSARGVDVIDMRRIDEIGAARAMRAALEAAEAEDALLHVSLDVDFLDPAVAPGVGTTVPGGATFREAHLAMEMICDSGRLAALDLVELNPFLDDRGRSARMLVELTESAFGRRIFDSATRAA